MLRLTILLALVANLKYVLLTEPSSISVPISAKNCTNDNEEYAECPNRVCREKTCNEVGYPLSCYQTDLEKIACGKPQCICKQGYVKNNYGKCIPVRECPSCGGDRHAWSGCGTYCTRCSNYKSKNIACILLCRLNSCDCRPGYVYDETKKKCVLPEECPPTCGLDEVPSDCANNGSLPTCANPNPNESCEMNLEMCKPGCVCADGHLRDNNGNCVPKDKCLPAKCPELEVPSDCINGGCERRQCSELARAPMCINRANAPCIAGCVCQTGYLRTAAGQCVPESECPSKEVCPREHEYYDLCPPSCPARTCGIDDRKLFCRAQLPTDKCKPACRCEQEYYRNPTGECVKFEECPPICGKNEKPSDCGNNACTPDCAQPDKNLYCKFDLRNCKPGCVCADGYLKNKIGVCVPKDKCNSLCSDDNEYFSDCPNKVCIPKRCDELGFKLQCTNKDKNSTVCDKPACLCNSGLVRNKDNVCVKPSECPSCAGDDNAELGCGTFCVRCSNYKDENRICGLGCILNGCKCRDKYIYDDIAKKCVLPENCQENFCLLPPVVGLCDALIPKFYYDPSKKDCVQFKYGGCGGNGNKFDTKEECLQTCSFNNKKVIK